ncbi:MAG: methionine--tRNA ligase [Bacteroidota bacterium]
MEPSRILVTAALPYANGDIHLGHLAGAYLPADIYCRYQRLKGRDVLFICGSDEHGVAITITAEKGGTTPQAVVDRYHERNREAFARFGMSFDNYSRTSLPLHHETAREFLLDFRKRGVLKEKEDQQFYDERARMFLPDRYVEGTCPRCGNPEARGDQCERCGTFLDPAQLGDPHSKITGDVPVVRTTNHLYFPLGAYQRDLEAYVAQMDRREGWKENVLNYCRSWFREGLQDRAVTRDLDWGVRVSLPGFERKVIYVWFDAVLGYISSTKEWAAARGTPEEWKKYWLDESVKYVAFIGKDNVVFHCIVFPAMLMAWNAAHRPPYVLPANVPANEFLNLEGQKFSKSRGWGVDVGAFLDRFPADPLRYYLTSILPENRDADFTWKEFQARSNNELADVLGNFIHRTLTFAVRSFEGKVPPRGEPGTLEEGLLEVLKNTPAAAGGLFERYRFREGMAEVMNLARAANKYFNDSEPWKTRTAAPTRCAASLNLCLQVCRSLAVLCSPVLPGAAERIWKMLNLEGDPARHAWDFAGELLLRDGHPLGTAEVLFTKIEDEVIARELQKIHAGGEPAPQPASGKAEVTLDDFARLDLRVGRVTQCERVPRSDRLLKLMVDVGGQTRQVLAGVARYYEPEALVGKSVVVVFNLKPARLMGHESQGMVLAASDGEGRLVLVAPEGEIRPGSAVS